MPGRNGTGPNGMGPMTGRGAGPCGGSAGQGWTNRAGGGFGMGYGRGGGRGRGWRQDWSGGPWGGRRGGGYGAAYGYPVPYGQPDPDLEKQALADQAKALQAQLDSIQNRLAEIESDPAKD